MSTISLCMIVKDEELLLENCLNSVNGIVDEIIILDTGSIDKTKEVAARYTDKIYDYVWQDDFSKARNESIKHATSDWILFLDADEELDEKGRRNILQAVKNQNLAGFTLPQIHFTNIYTTHPDFIPLENHSYKGYFCVDVLRLFRNHAGIKFDFCVHETVKLSLERISLKWQFLDAPIMHFHEKKGSRSINQKQEYYFKLSLKNLQQYPKHAKSYHDVAIYYNVMGNQEMALEFCKRAVELEPGNLDYLLNLSYRYRDLGSYDDAIFVLNKGLQIKTDVRIYVALGFNYSKNGNLSKAIECYESALSLNPANEKEILVKIKKLNASKNFSPHLSFSYSYG
jgi:glycosyltransferase involved in cell wall biosynthesis